MAKFLIILQYLHTSSGLLKVQKCDKNTVQNYVSHIKTIQGLCC